MRTLTIFDYDLPPLRPDLVGAAVFMACYDDWPVWISIKDVEVDPEIVFVDAER